MKALHLALATLLIAGTAAPLTGCGHRDYTNVPDPTASTAPTQIGVITVTVIDNQSQPVAGATVSLMNAQGAPATASVTSGADGTATFKGVNGGSGYTITASKGGVTGQQAGLEIDSDTPLVVKVMLVPPDASQGTINGSVTDAISHQPLDGATVSVMGTQNTVKSQADGTFVLKGVPVGNPTVVAIMSGYRENRASVVLTAGALQPISLPLAPAGDPSRLGHTLITQSHSLLEVDRVGNKVALYNRGGYMARPLVNGDTLIAGGGGAYEINSSNSVVWGYQPLIFGRLANAQGVYKASNGNVFVADTGNNRVLEISQSQKVEQIIRGSFNHPCSAEREEATHTTLIADTGNNRVVEVDDNGNPVWGLGGGTGTVLNHPTYATREPNGDTVIADSGNHRVLVINRAQGCRYMYGGDGKRETCYFPNSAQELPNGNLLIADTGNSRVIEVKPVDCSTQGTIVWQLNNLDVPMFAERL